ncbi:hypothetical protein LUTEI9C_50181 [Luteimonas sp. 9C]|nr:hypothetical protein LUTEI9C_50181 [Luteimonas sp. 9C]
MSRSDIGLNELLGGNATNCTCALGLECMSCPLEVQMTTWLKGPICTQTWLYRRAGIR